MSDRLTQSRRTGIALCPTCNGTGEAGLRRKALPSRLVQRITVDRETGCWHWAGNLDRHGYGRFGGELAHRQVYMVLVGSIPEGLQLDHLCRVTDCVNPEHLEPVTGLENVRRGAAAISTRCVNGHRYDEANTYRRPNGRRDCRACMKMRARAYRKRRATA